MSSHIVFKGAVVLLVGACSSPVGSSGAGENAVPEAVVALAAPYQNVATARLRPEDGCYWYLHEGPVETTLLPLRTEDGRSICVLSREEDAG